jgi:hypothetical protein
VPTKKRVKLEDPSPKLKPVKEKNAQPTKPCVPSKPNSPRKKKVVVHPIDQSQIQAEATGIATPVSIPPEETSTVLSRTPIGEEPTESPSDAPIPHRRAFEKKVRSLSTDTFYVLGTRIDVGDKTWPVEIVQERPSMWVAKIGPFRGLGRSHKGALVNLIRSVFLTTYKDGGVPGTKPSIVHNAIALKQEEINALNEVNQLQAAEIAEDTAQLAKITREKEEILSLGIIVRRKIFLIKSVAKSRGEVVDPGDLVKMFEVIEKICDSVLRGSGENVPG